MPTPRKLSVYRDSPDYEVVGVVEPDRSLRKQAENAPTYQRAEVVDARSATRRRPACGRCWSRRASATCSTTPRPASRRASTSTSTSRPANRSRSSSASSTPRRRQKLLVQMGYMYRYNPAVVLLREFLAEGLARRGVRGPRRHEQGRGRAGAEALRRVPGRHDVRARLPRSRPGRSASWASRKRSRRSAATHPALDDGLLDNMLAVLSYPRALATVKSSALEVEGFDRRHLVVCGTEGTFHIQPLDNPTARVSLSRARTSTRRGRRTLKFPKYTRYVADAADMARIIRGEKASDFPYEHDCSGPGDAARSVRSAAEGLTDLLLQRSFSPPPSRARIPSR